VCIRKRARAALTVTLTCALAVSLAGPAAAASRALPADDIGDPSAQALGLKTFRSPGSFTGYGFDRCITPSSQDMDTWRRSSPFAAVGIHQRLPPSLPGQLAAVPEPIVGEPATPAGLADPADPHRAAGAVLPAG